MICRTVVVFLSIVPCSFALVGSSFAAESYRIPPWVQNQLVESKVSGNMETFGKGVRGAPNHMIYDLRNRKFVKQTTWSEYGVGSGKNIGVVAESKPAWWMAEWKMPVDVNLIALSGAYPNQPQPDTAWKIELRTGGTWREHANGIGGWYNNGRYLWRGAKDESIHFDAIRVSLFSKDEQSPLKSIHFRGERDASWVVAFVPPIDARLHVSSKNVRLGESVQFEAERIEGDIRSWRWDYGDGESSSGIKTNHTYAKPGVYNVTLAFGNDSHKVRRSMTITVGPPIAARMTPLEKQVRVGEEIVFDSGKSIGPIQSVSWDFGNGETATGRHVHHLFRLPGIYQVTMTVTGGSYTDQCIALVRAHGPETARVPQVLLDTDQKNEQDDQYYLGYAVFSELDVLGVNSVHHGCAQPEQEAVNYAEILHVLDLAKKSGLSSNRIPTVFHGANQRLDVPDSGNWLDTEPVVTPAAEAILAAARGASDEHPVWVVPVGPGTNVASAVLMARREGLELTRRLRVMWLGGSDHAWAGEFNADNDPWSMFVVSQCGVELWIVPAPVGARVRIDKRTEASMYADNPLGRYLKEITPANNKPLFDPAALSAIIDMRLKLGWVTHVERISIAGPEEGYRWRSSDAPNASRVIRQIDAAAMKRDIFESMKGRPQRLRE